MQIEKKWFYFSTTGHIFAFHLEIGRLTITWERKGK